MSGSLRLAAKVVTTATCIGKLLSGAEWDYYSLKHGWQEATANPPAVNRQMDCDFVSSLPFISRVV